jgi:hypothetical protein
MFILNQVLAKGFTYGHLIFPTIFQVELLYLLSLTPYYMWKCDGQENKEI